MRAIQFDRFGGPEVLQWVELPEPRPASGQVRVRVKAIGVNPLDAKVRAGAMEGAFKTTLPSVPGGEVAGVVEACGAGVTAFAPGDEVFGWSEGAAYAEQAVAVVLAPKPPGLSWAQAVALPVAAETATRVLDLLAVRAGETLLLHGGAGVVGIVGVRLAVLRGVTVLATGSPANQVFLERLGAIPLVYGEGLQARVRALGRQVDAVFDASGKGALPDSLALRGGTSRIVTIADPAAFQLGVTFSSGTAGGRNAPVLRAAGDLAVAGKLTVPIAATFPLAEAARAHALIEGSHAPGKIVLLP
jgi:NADPH:quinone reductase-like Zn-dependent oxidoreductase